MIAMTILLVVLGTVLSVLSKYQQTYVGQQEQAGVQLGVDSALELMSQEIAQAGEVGFTPQTLSASIVASPLAQSAPISSTASLFVGEQLLVDTGAAQELVTVQGVGQGSFTGIFTQNHVADAPVTALGVFGTGVLTTTAGNTLDLYGDINADGTLVFVEYDCNTATGELTRSVTPVGNATQAAAQPLLTGLAANPGGTPCFQFQTVPFGGVTYVTAVKVTLTDQSAQANPQTGAPATMTASLTIAPKNVLRALSFAEMTPPRTDLLEPTPAGVPIP